jgi:hypothetical protein
MEPSMRILKDSHIKESAKRKDGDPQAEQRNATAFLDKLAEAVPKKERQVEKTENEKQWSNIRNAVLETLKAVAETIFTQDDVSEEIDGAVEILQEQMVMGLIEEEEIHFSKEDVFNDPVINYYIHECIARNNKRIIFEALSQLAMVAEGGDILDEKSLRRSVWKQLQTKREKVTQKNFEKFWLSVVWGPEVQAAILENFLQVIESEKAKELLRNIFLESTLERSMNLLLEKKALIKILTDPELDRVIIEMLRYAVRAESSKMQHVAEYEEKDFSKESIANVDMGKLKMSAIDAGVIALSGEERRGWVSRCESNVDYIAREYENDAYGTSNYASNIFYDARRMLKAKIDTFLPALEEFIEIYPDYADKIDSKTFLAALDDVAESTLDIDYYKTEDRNFYTRPGYGSRIAKTRQKLGYRPHRRRKKRNRFVA